MNPDTPFIRQYRPQISHSRVPSDMYRAQSVGGFKSSQALRFRKRRRVDSRPRAESTSTSASSSSISVSSASSISASSASGSSTSNSASSSAFSRSTSRSASSAQSSSSHSASSTRLFQSSSSSRSGSASRSAFRPTSTVFRTITARSSSSARFASTSVYLSTVITTATGSTITVVSTSPGTLGTSGGGGTPFSHNVGGIVGVAIGGVIALILGAAIIFFTCKRMKRQQRPGSGSAMELPATRAPTDAQSTEPAPAPAPAASPTDTASYHYARARPRPQMPPSPPSSSSIAGLIGRLRGGRTSTSSSVPKALESTGTTPLAPPSPAFFAPHPRRAASPQRTPGTPPPGSPRFSVAPLSPPSPRPGSLLNPRVVLPSAPSSSAPEWVGWRPAAAAEQPAPAPALALPTPPEDPPGSPVGLLRPSLAVLQFESSRTIHDHEDYSRPIGGRVSAARMESDMSVQTVDPEGGGGGGNGGHA
ncbi:hypothetical protein B0H19DRAFT_1143833 [Mycena capillaripes]|nr:hypothetical protein B0H19DRAFT_1143833 [Mycena capillaripes]